MLSSNIVIPKLASEGGPQRDLTTVRIGNAAWLRHIDNHPAGGSDFPTDRKVPLSPAFSVQVRDDKDEDIVALLQIPPILSHANFHQPRHCQRMNILHLLADQRAHGLQLSFWNFEHELVVNLQRHA